MSKRERRLLKAKKIKKAFRRNRAALASVLTLGGIAAVAAMSPRLRARTRQLKNSVVNRLSGHHGEVETRPNGMMSHSDRPVIDAA